MTLPPSIDVVSTRPWSRHRWANRSLPPAEILDTFHCQSSEDMSQIPDDCVALMVTSPPYNVGKDYDEDLSPTTSTSICWRGVLEETYRVLEPGGRVAINVANLGRKPYLALNHIVAGLLRDLGFLLRGEIIWQKAAGRRRILRLGVVAVGQEPDPARSPRVRAGGQQGLLPADADRRGQHRARRVPGGHPVGVEHPACLGQAGGPPGPVPGGSTQAADRALHLPGRPGAGPLHRVGFDRGGRRRDRAPLHRLRHRPGLPRSRAATESPRPSPSGRERWTPRSGP